MTTATQLFALASLLILAAQVAHGGRHPPGVGHHKGKHSKVISTAGVIDPNSPYYHGGRILNSSPALSLYVIWYGNWKQGDKAVLKDFLLSLDSTSATATATAKKTGRRLRGLQQEETSVADWWRITQQYTDSSGATVSPRVSLKGEHVDAGMSQGSALTQDSTEQVLRAGLKSFGGSLPTDTSALYLVLTSAEVKREGFCSLNCGSHAITQPGLLEQQAASAASSKGAAKKRKSSPVAGPLLTYAWVGDAQSQCPGFCGFPFTAPPYLPARAVTLVKPPNGNKAMDSMIIVVAHEMAESATDPDATAWYNGDASMPNEIADSCLGVFGPLSYSGNPGVVSQDPTTGAGYNAVGMNGRKFLLPWLWSAQAKQCVGKGV